MTFARRLLCGSAAGELTLFTGLPIHAVGRIAELNIWSHAGRRHVFDEDGDGACFRHCGDVWPSSILGHAVALDRTANHKAVFFYLYQVTLETRLATGSGMHRRHENSMALEDAQHVGDSVVGDSAGEFCDDVTGSRYDNRYLACQCGLDMYRPP